MPNLPQVGLDAVIANLSSFESGAKAIQRAYDDINHKASAVEKATGGLGTALTGLGGNLLNIGAIAGGVALAGVTALGAGLTAFATTGISKAIDLDAQMATIAATMNTTKDAVGPLKDLILDLALDPNLTVNTTQAADAIQLLAQNGATADQIMGGLAKSTVALANATGADFGVAANTASGVMKVFNLEAKDMGIAVDGITGVVNQSKFGIEDYAQAFSQAGSVAAGMGVSLQDFNTVITATADSFTSGSDAGTSFKTLLQRLANPTEDVQTAMDKYGISLFDAEGNMRPLSQVAGQLNSVLQGTATITETVGGATKKEALAAETAAKAIGSLTSKIDTNQKQLQLYNDQLALEIGYYGEGSPKVRARQIQIEKLTNTINDQKLKLGDYQGAIALVDGAQEKLITTTKTLTEAEKAELAAVIGGADAARIVLALSQTTAAEFDTLSGSVNDVGQAFRSAATRVDSVKGAFEIFKGIVEAIQIQVGDKFLPILRSMTVMFTDLATKAAPVVVGFFDNIAKAIDKVIGAFERFGIRGATISILGQLGLEPSQIASVMSTVDKVVLSIDKVKGAFDRFGVRGAAVSILGQLGLEPSQVGTILQTIDSVFAQITEAFNVFMSEGLFGGVALAGGEVSRTGGLLKLIGLDDETITTIQNVILGIIPFITSHLAELQGAIIGMGAAIVAIGIAGTIISIGVAIAGLVTPVGLIIAAAALLGAAWAGNWGGIQEKTFAVWAVVQPVLTQLIDWLSVNIPVALQFLADAWTNVLLPGILAFTDFLTNTVFPIISDLVTGYIDVTSTRAQVLADTWTTYLLPAITGVVNYIKTVTIPFFTSLANLLSAVAGVAVTALAGLWQNILRPALVVIAGLIKTQLQPGLDGLSIILDTVGKIIGEKVSPMADKLGGKVLPALTKGLETVTKWVKDLTGYFNGLASSIKSMTLPAWLQPGSPPPLAFALQDIANAANMAGMAMGNFSQATIDSLLGVNRNLVSVNGAIGAARDDIEKFFKGKLNNDNISPTLKIMGQIFRDNSEAILNATDRVAKFRELISKIDFGVNSQQQKDIMNAAGIWIHQFDKNLAKMKAAQRQIFIEAGKTALTIGQKLNDIINSNVEILDERVKTLQDFIASGEDTFRFGGDLVNQVHAQKLLNEALAEQRDIQDDILQLKQNEQKLSFLEKQLSLVETLNEAGLDVNAILGGISLGLDASIPDMIAATNRLVMAMIEQVNKDLQMGSPSKVMMRKGEQSGQGFIEGILGSIPGITGAMKKAIFGPSLVSGPVLSGGSNSRVTNNNFSMNVNSGASPQGVMQQFEIARAMA